MIVYSGVAQYPLSRFPVPDHLGTGICDDKVEKEEVIVVSADTAGATDTGTTLI